MLFFCQNCIVQLDIIPVGWKKNVTMSVPYKQAAHQNTASTTLVKKKKQRKYVKNYTYSNQDQQSKVHTRKTHTRLRYMQTIHHTILSDLECKQYIIRFSSTTQKKLQSLHIWSVKKHDPKKWESGIERSGWRRDYLFKKSWSTTEEISSSGFPIPNRIPSNSMLDICRLWFCSRYRNWPKLEICQKKSGVAFIYHWMSCTLVVDGNWGYGSDFRSEIVGAHYINCDKSDNLALHKLHSINSTQF